MFVVQMLCNKWCYSPPNPQTLFSKRIHHSFNNDVIEQSTWERSCKHLGTHHCQWCMSNVIDLKMIIGFYYKNQIGFQKMDKRRKERCSLTNSKVGELLIWQFTSYFLFGQRITHYEVRFKASLIHMDLQQVQRYILPKSWFLEWNKSNVIFIDLNIHICFSSNWSCTFTTPEQNILFPFQPSVWK